MTLTPGNGHTTTSMGPYAQRHSDTLSIEEIKCAFPFPCCKVRYAHYAASSFNLSCRAAAGDRLISTINNSFNDLHGLWE